MIIILQTDLPTISPDLKELLAWLDAHDGVQTRVYSYEGQQHRVTEVHVLGPATGIDSRALLAMPVVSQIVEVAPKLASIAPVPSGSGGFEYMGLRFDQDAMHIFPGIRAVTDPSDALETFAAIAAAGVPTAHAGVFAPRQRLHDAPSVGVAGLENVLVGAGEHGLRVVCVPVYGVAQLEALRACCEVLGTDAPGVLVKVEGRDIELLEAVGAQRDFPVLYQRGPHQGLEQAMETCAEVAAGGNRHIMLGLAGVNGPQAGGHVWTGDFGSIAAVKRATRLPVAVDASAIVGGRWLAHDGFGDVHHMTAQGVIAGANMVFVDVHPSPGRAGAQALGLEALGLYLEDVCLVREAYLNRRRLLE